MPLIAQAFEVTRPHKEEMEWLGTYDAYGLVCVAVATTTTSHSNIFDNLVLCLEVIIAVLLMESPSSL